LLLIEEGRTKEFQHCKGFCSCYDLNFYMSDPEAVRIERLHGARDVEGNWAGRAKD
jgi:hypothetical protein